MSTIHVSKDYQFRFIPAKPRHQHVLEVISPHIPTITLGILSLNLLQWQYKSGTHRIGDILAYVTCLILHNLSPPLLSLCLAIAYTTWVSLPGSFTSLALPSHEQFLKQTTFQAPPHTEEEICIVCWDEEALLGKLPCKHTVCKNCLEAMGSALQTACPMCKHPLFSLHDRLVFCISKAHVSIQAVTSTLHLLVLYDEVQHYRYFNIAITLAFITFLGWILVKGYDPLIKSGGENWWRLRASCKGGMGRAMRSAGLAFVMSATVLCHTLYRNRGLFL
jgi:hypothetical protein